MRTSSRERTRNLVDRIHPLTKLYSCLSLVVLSFFLELTGQTVLISLALSLALLSSKRGSIFKRLLRYVIPAAILILLLNLLFYPAQRETTHLFGIKVNPEGFEFGLGVSIRLTIISLSLLLFFTTTSAHELSTALLLRGASPRVIYVFVHSLQMMDILRRKIQRIYIAQSSRGLHTTGHPVKRVRAFLPMLLPVIFSYLSESLERGLALELRGLGLQGPKTFLTEIRESRFERAINYFLLLCTTFIVAWKILKWLLL